MEDALSDEKKWLAGEKIELAKVNASFAMDMAVKRGWFVGEMFPRLKGWYERVVGREGYRRALEKGGPYDLVKFTQWVENGNSDGVKMYFRPSEIVSSKFRN